MLCCLAASQWTSKKDKDARTSQSQVSQSSRRPDRCGILEDPGKPAGEETPEQRHERHRWEEHHGTPKYGPYAGKVSDEYTRMFKQRAEERARAEAVYTLAPKMSV